VNVYVVHLKPQYNDSSVCLGVFTNEPEAWQALVTDVRSGLVKKFPEAAVQETLANMEKLAIDDEQYSVDAFTGYYTVDRFFLKGGDGSS
jgi:hypothetical protein